MRARRTRLAMAADFPVATVKNPRRFGQARSASAVFSWLRPLGPRIGTSNLMRTEPGRELLVGETSQYWATPAAAVVTALATSVQGLSGDEASRRLRLLGPNRIVSRARLTRTRVLLKQFRNPLLAILIFAAAASGFSREWIDASVVLSIVVATIFIGFWREYAAESAAAALQSRIRTTARVFRDGALCDVPIE